jgi:hypothetical protein
MVVVVQFPVLCGVMNRFPMQSFQRKLPDLLLGFAIMCLVALILLSFSWI